MLAPPFFMNWFDLLFLLLFHTHRFNVRFFFVYIFISQSTTGTIRNNHIKSCVNTQFYYGAIYVQLSHNNIIENNTIEGCDGGSFIILKDDDRVRKSNTGVDGRIGGWFTENNIVRNNVAKGRLRAGFGFEGDRSRCGASSLCSRGSHNNKFINNKYENPDQMLFKNGETIYGSSGLNYEGWKALGQQ